MCAFNSDLFFGILIGLIAYILLYLGKGIQKYAITGLQEDKTLKSKHSGVWIFGTVLTVSFMGLQWVALAVFHANVNIIAPFEGVGLISLLIFSYFVLKEKLNRWEFAGTILIIAGTVVITVFYGEPIALIKSDFNLMVYLITLGAFTVPIVILSYLAFKNPSKIKGILLGLSAGTFMAFQTISKRITDIPELALIFTFVTFTLAALTLGYTQFAFTMAKANIVVLSFASVSIILTSVLGYFSINENILPAQIGGICCVIVGIILMNIFQKDEKKERDKEVKTLQL
jgi:drug/metabolite transporter (DMT)-like permease